MSESEDEANRSGSIKLAEAVESPEGYSNFLPEKDNERIQREIDGENSSRDSQPSVVGELPSKNAKGLPSN